MNIIPAIDLYDGNCVRLDQGCFDAVTTYNTDPTAQAQLFVQSGATQLHIVDLNGAKTGKPVQLEMIRRIRAKTDLTIQTGGGLRYSSSIASSLDAGVDRVVIGSLAAKDPNLLCSLIARYGAKRFVLALDVRINEQPEVVINGWQQNTGLFLWDLLSRYSSYPDLSVLCTDISRDGMLGGPNLLLYSEAVKCFPQFIWQASGGVAELKDLRLLALTGVSAVIVGKALYEKRFSLQQALTECVSC
jgi:phosphoribosylformimino-5-aminoimidazole carboxamide ribotide isomerase